MPSYNTRIPVEWYVDRIERLRAELGSNLNVRVFSDGTDGELEPLLKLKNLERATRGNAISDIISLSRSKILVASGSTFSLWASFIGDGPAIYYPKRMFQRLKSSENAEIESAPGEALPSSFLDIAVKALGNA